eukprot:6577140-Prymnesium_polylepis.1
MRARRAASATDHRGQDLLRARRPLAVDQFARPDPRHRPQAGGAARRCDVRSDVVRSGGH